MYELGERLEGVVVDPGTNLLFSGPPMTGKRDIALDVLAEGSRHGEGALFVTTKDGADRVVSDYTERVADDALLGVVDCVTRQQGMSGTELDDDLVRYASSPVDLTGIGIELSDLLREFYDEHGRTQNRVLLHSLSTLLMYSDLQTVFRFLHVFTGRVQSADALGLFVIDSTGHDQQTLSTLKQLFDGVVEVEDSEGERRHRLLGVGDGEWHSH